MPKCNNSEWSVYSYIKVAGTHLLLGEDNLHLMGHKLQLHLYKTVVTNVCPLHKHAMVMTGMDSASCISTKTT